MKISMICGIAALFNWAGIVACLVGVMVGDIPAASGPHWVGFLCLLLLAVSLTIIANLVGEETR
jgi:hypothetical protein